MNCYTSGLIGLGMLGATFFTMSVTKSQNIAFKEKLPPELSTIYENITNERRNLYIQGLLLGLFLSYFIVKCIKVTNSFHKATLFLAITIPISVLYYFLMPKSDYMLNHLKTEEQNKAWLSIYTTMRQRYFLGFLIGSLAAIPISYSLCTA